MGEDTDVWKRNQQTGIGRCHLGSCSCRVKIDAEKMPSTSFDVHVGDVRREEPHPHEGGAPEWPELYGGQVEAAGLALCGRGWKDLRYRGCGRRLSRQKW